MINVNMLFLKHQKILIYGFNQSLKSNRHLAKTKQTTKREFFLLSFS